MEEEGSDERSWEQLQGFEKEIQDTDRHGGGGGGLEAQGEEAERLVEVKSRRP